MNYKDFKEIFNCGFIENNFIYLCAKGIYCKIPIKRKNVIFKNAKITDSTIDKFLSESKSNIKEKEMIINIFSNVSNIMVEDTNLRHKGNYIFEAEGIILQFYSQYIEAAKEIFNVYCVDDIFEGLEDFRFNSLNCFINERACYSLYVEEENEKEPIQMQILPALLPDTLTGNKEFFTKNFFEKMSKNKIPEIKKYYVNKI